VDSYEIAVLGWLRKQRQAVTGTEVHKQFATLSFKTLRDVLKSLESQDEVEQAAPRGLMETWQLRKR
jgi:hypothetical protein